LKQNWPLKIFILLCLLIPLAFSFRTFDEFGTPKLTVFYLGAGLLLLAILTAYQSLMILPKYLLGAFGFFISVQAWQTFRLTNIAAGLWGAYGQSESLFVQMGFIIISLAAFLFIRDEESRRKIRGTLLLAVYLVGIYGIFQYLYGDPISQTFTTRMKSFFGDPNALGAFLVLTLPIILVEMKYYSWSLQGFLPAGALFIGIIALFLTFSRSAWLGFLLSLVPLIYQAFLRFFRRRRSNQRDWLLIGAVFLLITGGMLCGQILTHFQSIADREYTLSARVSSMAQGNDSGRALIWSTAWQAFKKYPLFGYGIGSFQWTFHRFKSPAAVKFWSPERDLREVHNETLHYLATQGILGLLAYFGLLAALFWVAKGNGLLRILSIEKTALWAGIIGYFCYVQFNYPLIHYSFLFWIYWGILLGFQAAPFNSPVKYQAKPMKPILIVVMALAIAIWSFLSINIFRADCYYNSAFNKTRYHHYRQAFALYREAISLNPWQFHYHYRYGISLFRAAGWEKKNKHFALASHYLNLAKAEFLYLNKKNPNRYEPLFFLGQISETLTNLEKAANYYQQALRLYPLNYKILFRLAKVKWLMGNKTDSLKAVQAGSVLAPDYIKEMVAKEQITGI
jgi:O-antigen ligase